MMINCPYCNQQHPSEAEFCPNTGKRLLHENASIAAEGRTPSSITQPSKISITGLSITIFAVLMIIIGFVLISNSSFGFVKSNDQDDIQANNESTSNEGTSFQSQIEDYATETSLASVPEYTPTSTRTPKPIITLTPTLDRHRKLKPYTAIPDCAKSRVYVGDIVIIEDDITNLFIRSYSDNHPSDNIIGYFRTGEKAEIIDGPVCSWGWIMWKIRKVSGGSTGWISESDGKSFWLQLPD